MKLNGKSSLFVLGLMLVSGGRVARAAADDNNFSNVEDAGFDDMDREAAKIGTSSDGPAPDENAPSAFDAEFKDEPPDLPDDDGAGGNAFDDSKPAKGKKGAKAPAKAKGGAPATGAKAAAGGAKSAVGGAKAAMPSASPAKAAMPSAGPAKAAMPTATVAPVAAPVAAKPKGAPTAKAAAAMGAPKSAGAANAVAKPVPGAASAKQVTETPIAPANAVPKISGETDVSGTPENSTMEPIPGAEEVPPVSAVAPPPATGSTAKPVAKQSAVPRAVPAPNPAVSTMPNGAVPTENVELPADDTSAQRAFVDRDGQSPGPDQGPVPRELIPMNEFGGAPAFPGARRIMAEGEAPEEYKVEQGDTLFDICDQLVDDPGYWPKLWALNPEIANPHFIYPGMKLRFYPGDDEMPPFLQVVSEDELVPVDNAEIKPQELVREDITQLLYREKKPDPTEKKAVAVPDFVTDDELKNIDISQEFEDVGTVFVPSSISVMVPAFVFEEELKPLGVVKSGVSGELLIDGTSQVLLKSEENGLAAGTLYTVVRLVGPLNRPHDNSRIGFRYDFIGQLKISGVMGEATIGKIVFNRLGLQPGDIVMPYTSVQRKVPLASQSATTSGSSSEVVAFEDPNSKLGGNRSLVLLEKGTSDLANGSVVNIFQDTARFQSRFIDHKIPDLSRKVAKVFIIDTSTKVAVGMVLDNLSEVYVGDYAGTPGVKTEEKSEE